MNTGLISWQQDKSQDIISIAQVVSPVSIAESSWLTKAPNNWRNLIKRIIGGVASIFWCQGRLLSWTADLRHFKCRNAKRGSRHALKSQVKFCLKSKWLQSHGENVNVCKLLTLEQKKVLFMQREVTAYVCEYVRLFLNVRVRYTEV